MAKKAAYCAILTALAMIFGYIEMLVPISLGIPGIKLGLANLVIVVALYMLPSHQVFFIQLARIILISFLFGNMSMMLYSLSGGILSFSVMCILKHIKGFSVIGISIAGGISHNIGQVIMASVIVKNVHIVFYLPVLMISGIITGFLIGMLAYKVLSLINKNWLS